ncbi:Prenyltransferase and squalene oxidase repeat-containing protein [Amycolatopsis pretoriensis]|uniref:Prenyltransferase and squalene oxidase repeat-containing protein n=1 Tax=Amycolatopsis pretoriensis TaxID=218821 RepID=A0A1H5RGV3_9PSEU|nr:prenyltransferase/squalene oxidase repeat-containing protein [Amycolatopsis pretoriensis]SEF37294.1 Prenyltransferase and squalene oxidase repeat-containing protein [Amycolatopsis pretoriensis]
MPPVHELLAGLLAEPAGQVSPSVYATGRLVTSAPWLTGHHDRLEFLAATRRPDGTWGEVGGYRLVPTLSATEALLSALRRDRLDPAPRARLLSAAEAGLAALVRLLGTGESVALPDTVAVELLVPDLIEQVNAHGFARLPVPRNVDAAKPAQIRAAVAAGMPIPVKLAHSLELAGSAAAGAASVTAYAGSVGCSPPSTAGWLADAGFRGGQPESVRFLEGLVARHRGPVPTVVPITEFERAWVVADVLRGFPGARVPAELVRALGAAVAAGPTGGGPGLPPDADTTSATFFALSRLGRHRAPECLFEFELDDHFCCWHGERTASPTANAHVLEAFDAHLAHRPADAARYSAAVAKIVRFLGETQEADGSWADKWHASPYYATACCVQGLTVPAAAGPGAAAALRHAVAWVLATQRPDGAWGRWAATAEETAYALRVLLAAESPEAGRAIAAGEAWLRGLGGRYDLVPLWHDKDLYTPAAVVRAAILATGNQLRYRSAVRGIAS